MAAIDKVYAYDYEDFTEFRLWCLRYCKKALPYFYNFFMSYTEWYRNKREQYKDAASNCKSFFERFKTEDDLYKCYFDSYRAMNDNRSEKDIMDQTNDEWNEMENRKRIFSTHDRETIMREDFSIPIANLPSKLDRYLLWHCPLHFIRVYLKENCGYETRWYHRIYFKK